jgi:hypothetical protein
MLRRAERRGGVGDEALAAPKALGVCADRHPLVSATAGLQSHVTSTQVVEIPGLYGKLCAKYATVERGNVDRLGASEEHTGCVSI